jgi:RHS repeat-associated protein
MWTWNSDPFGTDAANPNPAGAGAFAYNLRFPGQLFDGQAGLHFNGNRDYDPAIGRYSESDPIRLDGGVGTYTYVDSDPLFIIDPEGLSPIKLIKLCVKGYKLIRNVSKAEAIKIAKNGGGSQTEDGWEP